MSRKRGKKIRGDGVGKEGKRKIVGWKKGDKSRNKKGRKGKKNKDGRPEERVMGK